MGRKEGKKYQGSEGSQKGDKPGSEVERRGETESRGVRKEKSIVHVHYCVGSCNVGEEEEDREE